ncbi:MAG TPA: AI-2E family transporter, partial [Alphaproteobacteria bacterium]|nr:AI-2E family transporter [Alphaproteobacteria bacterium]
MSAQKQALFWLVAAALFVAALSLFNKILLPFITGLAIAYFLDPLVDYLERRGVSR